MSCIYNKQGYATKELAEQALYFAIANQRKGRKVPIRYFKCPDCGRYHLTSQEKKEP